MLYLIIIEFFIVRIIHGFPYQLPRQYDVSYGSPAYKHCVCGRKNPPQVGDIRVVGGYQVKANEYPWMTMITRNGSLLCGGSLINDRYVLTAAHILLRRINEMKVVVGEYDICQPDAETTIFSIQRVIKHPEYNNITHYADIMLIKLSMRVTFNEYIRPICLPGFDKRFKTIKKYSGRRMTALGWGLADIGKEVCIQREVELDVFKHEDCDAKVETLICAGVYGNGRDTCAGDSGGPLQFFNKHDKYEVIGVVSTGIGCGTGNPGYYTDVPRMVPWILRVTYRDSLYCWR